MAMDFIQHLIWIHTSGYMLKVAEASDFYYPSGALAMSENDDVNIPEFDYREFEFNGSISASVNIEDIIVDTQDKLFAYSNGELRGEASPDLFPPTGKLVITMMIYSNMENEKMDFEFYNNETDKYYSLDQTINFNKDMIIGDARNTLELNETPDLPVEFKLMPAYPNPFNPVTNINYSISEAQNIKLCVYDIMGREVQILESGFRNIGEYSIIWDASNFASGIYYINLIAGSLIETQKLMLIK